MGYFLKNRQIPAASTGTVIPSGSTAERPSHPNPGFTRYNTDTNVMEYWNGTAWKTFSTSGGIVYSVDNFTGDGTTTTFTMSVAVSSAVSIQVFVGGLYQTPTTSYTVNGTTALTFTSAPPLSAPVNVIHTAD